MILFPDTNIFLEAKELEECPWEELATDEIRMLVCRAVLNEIDDHKRNQNQRIQKCARKWNSLFRKLLKPDATPLRVRNADPVVTAEIGPPSIPDPPISWDLDLSRKDDQIVYSTLTYRSQNPSEDVRLFTGDTGPLATAYAVNLPAIQLEEHWRRELEPSKEEKELKRGEKELSDYKSNLPRPILVIYDDQNQEVVPHLEIQIFRYYRELTASEREMLINDLKRDFPPGDAATLKEPPITTMFYAFRRWQPPSDAEITQYLNVDYPRWISEVEKMLSNLGTNLRLCDLFGSFKLVAKNEGVCPASNAELRIEALGNFSFLSEKTDSTDIFPKSEVPRKPKPPAGSLSSFKSLITPCLPQVEGPSMNLLEPINRLKSPARDKNTWYLKEEVGESKYSTKKVWTCDEWRHQADAFEKTIYFKIGSGVNSGPIGAIKRIFHAVNLPNPVQKQVPLRISIESGNLIERARNLLYIKQLPSFRQD